MDILRLGYTKKWVDYGFLDKDGLAKQLTEFQEAIDPSTSDYRYESFQNWLKAKKKMTNNEVEHYLELAKSDVDDRMAGLAITNLFVSTKISDKQFEIIRKKLPEFGDWTKKLITREVVMRRLRSEELTTELFDLSYNYKKKYKDSRPLVHIIKTTDNSEFLLRFKDLDIGKKIKTLASNKLNRLIK